MVISKGVLTVNKFKTTMFRLKMTIGVAVLALIALPPLTPHIYIWRLGRIPLSPLQMIYVILSLEIVLAVYAWGVGNWSRFEPPQTSSVSAAQETNSPAQPPGPVPTPPVPQNMAPRAQPPGTPPAPQGGH
jgi:hypothetical protein